MDSVKAFIELVHSDPELLAQVSNLPPSDISAVVGIAQELGFSFTLDQYQSYLDGSAPDSSELAEDELSMLSGGVGVQSSTNPIVTSSAVATAVGFNDVTAVSSTASGSGW